MKKSLFKKLIALLVPLLVISNLSIPVLAEEKEEIILKEEVVELEVVRPTDLADNDELLEGYIEKLAFGVPTPMETQYQKNAARYSKLSGGNLGAYNLLKTELAKIAAGDEDSTKFSFRFGDVFIDTDFTKMYTASELGVDTLVEGSSVTTAAKEALLAKMNINIETYMLIRALSFDLPFDLFWYNKTIGTKTGSILRYAAGYNSSGELVLGFNPNSEYSFAFAVSEDFKPSGSVPVEEFSTGKYAPVQTDKAKIKSLSTAVTFANSIVNRAKSKSDADKLAFYKDEICKEVAYNDAAANPATKPPYGNPWQLIYVFDQNNQTDVVCEGYSKAFKFLCDLTSFSNKTTEAHIVTGNMGGGTGEGGHMWNLVSIDGYNYLVDVTNCDEGTIGHSDYLFMRENEVGDADQYSFNIYGHSISYIYDDSTKALYDESERRLAGKDISNDAVISNLIDKEYTGSEITQSPLVTLNSTGTQLIEGTDYTVEYENNIEVGTATVRVRGIGDYRGFVEDTFNITAHPINEKDVANAVIENIEDQVYTGEQIRPTPTVEINGVALVNGTDYELAYENNTNVGTATIRVVGKGEYEGQKEKSFNITPASISTTEVINVVDKTYTGSEITQALNVMFGNKTLVEGTDYTISYSNNINVGTATVTITGKGNYKDTTSKTFKINPVSIEGAIVSDIADTEYTGNAITQSFTVTLDGKTLTEGTDYTVSYSNNTNVGTANVTIKGEGNYAGTVNKTFEITPIKVDIPTAKTGLVYNGKSQTGVTTGDKYTLTGNTGCDAGNYTTVAALKDKNNYVWSDGTTEDKNITWNIAKASISKAAVSEIVDQMYTGKEIQPVPTVSLNGKTLVNGTDYTVSYGNNTNVGTATVTITGIGNYVDEKNAEFKIVEIANIDKAIVTGLSAKTYTGKAITQKPTVTLNGKTLVEGTDYKVSYTNNKNVGTATVTITGMGNYVGTKTATFKINANTKIKLNKTSATIGTKNVGKYKNKTSVQLSATVTGHNNTKVTWTSSNPKVAKVDKNTGKVTAVSDPNHTVSTVTITATTVDGKKATCKVTVEDPINAFVRRLYKYCLNRNPDKDGFNYWTSRLRSKKITASQAVEGFFNSSEMIKMKLSNSETIERCYLVMMDRKSDAGGKKYWLNKMSKGLTKKQLLKGFVDSNEFIKICKDFNITKGTIK